MRGLVLAETGDPAHLLPRTLRALRLHGLEAVVREPGRPLGLCGPAWLLRAGAFPLGAPAPPPPSATGRSLCALGASDGADARAPARAASVYLDAALAERARGAVTLEEVGDVVRRAGARVVRFPALDVGTGGAVRVAELVTSLQIGGAERVARDLAAELPRVGLSARLFALGSPTRARLPSVAATLDLSVSALPPAARVERLVRALASWGADVVHAHLFGPDVLDALAAAGFPVAVTVHNARPGWPEGTEALEPARAALVLACARAVEDELRAAGVRAPVRTAWNGVDPARTSPDAERAELGAALRARLGVGAADVLLALVANPRPQKRLALAAGVAEALRERLGRPVHLALAGAASRGSEVAAAELAALEREAAARDVPLHRLGALGDVAPVLAGADALLSTSAWEGLSLSQLEALAAGLPVVATRVGGAEEVAARAPLLTLVAPDAPPEAYAGALEASLGPPRAAALPPSFTLRAMARAHARLLPRALASRPRSGGPALALVTNNFVVGGAQTSARRLLAGLRARGARVLALTLEERPDRPTPGLEALRAAGVPVEVLPPGVDPALAVARGLERLDAFAPAAVVFWNAIAEHKLLFADALLGVPVFDASPGEMFFSSLERCFERLRPDLAFATPRHYGARLAAAVVKFAGERARAEATLGCPVRVIPNGVPLRPRAPRSADGRVVVGTACRLHPHKRLDLLLDAFASARERCAALELVIAGGPDAGAEGWAEGLARAYRHLPVRWLGPVEDVGALHDRLDVFALIAEPAGCPNASLEAMAAGLPTLATDVGGAREQLEGAGVVVPREGVEALADALVELAESPALRASVGGACFARAAERFSVERFLDDWERLFFR